MRIPDTLQELTADWLTDALRSSGKLGQARISKVDYQRLDETQGATGQLARLQLTWEPPEYDGPEAMIVKLSAANPAMRADINALKIYEREIRFYQQLAPHISLRTPEAYYSDIDTETGLSVLLLEDLSGGYNPDKFGTCSDAELKIAVTELARLQAGWWEDKRLGEQEWIVQGYMEAIYHRSQLAYQQRWPQFLARVGHLLPEGLKEIGEKLGDCIVQLNNHLTRPPRTLWHRDFHPANMFFFAGDGEALSLVVIDWQLLTFGRGVSDMAMLLSRAVEPEVRRRHEMRWLKTYHATLVEHGVSDYSFEQCLHDYRLAMFIGLFRIVCLIGGGNLTPEEEARFCSTILSRNCAAILDLNAGELLS